MNSSFSSINNWGFGTMGGKPVNSMQFDSQTVSSFLLDAVLRNGGGPLGGTNITSADLQTLKMFGIARLADGNYISE